jgi:hypothetical protein
MRAALLLLALAGCDPAWGVNVRIQNPMRAPIENATLALACPESGMTYGNVVVRTTPDGKGHVGGIGGQFPVGCDVYIAKPGYVTHRIRYRDLCPNGPNECEQRVFDFDLVLEPTSMADRR